MKYIVIEGDIVTALNFPGRSKRNKQPKITANGFLWSISSRR